MNRGIVLWNTPAQDQMLADQERVGIRPVVVR